MTPTHHSLCLLALTLLLLGACTAGDGRDQVAATAAEAGDEEAGGELPPGHPPLTAPTPAPTPAPVGGVAPPPPGSGAGATGLSWTAPESWHEEVPSSAMRKAQYRVSGSGGDAELVVFYFGPGQGGDAMSNAIRWADQFTQPDGSSSRDALVTEQLEIGGIPVLLAEVAGTYSGGMTMMGGQSEELEEHMLIGAVAEGPDANWFFKLTGPAATVEEQRAAFRAMVESLSQGS